MATPSFSDELEKLKEYLRSTDNEDAKRPLLYPLFQKLFKDKFKIESNVFGADIYVQGQIIVESKTDFSQWVEGFYQGLHYQKKYGLAYNTIMVIANQFVGIWKLNKIPEFAVILSHTADPKKPPSYIGKDNARKTQKAERGKIAQSAFYFLQPKDLEGDIFSGAKNLTTESYAILKILKNLDVDRLQINTHNFINCIEQLKFYFKSPIDAVHAFYTIIAYWDITATVAVNDLSGEIRIVGFRGSRMSDSITIAPALTKEFKNFVESQYVFTNEGSGLTVDYYFSRFDEVMARIDPAYVKQHGIFFTNDNLSKFALWFAKYHFPGNIDENYIVLDPAGGSGNLVSSWRGKLKHKIISELQPDLLRIIERRMKVDPFHIQSGFTIIPKTSESKGLNFLDRNAQSYLNELKRELSQKNISLNKPIAFLLNPPYKNTDENQKFREDKNAHYVIDPSIIDLTGDDASKERYLAFLGQILNICRIQAQENKADIKPVVMIFTPTSWLMPRPTYLRFRRIWDQHFKFHSGFIVTSNEFFKLDGRWPLAFTIWNYDFNEQGYQNDVKVHDLTGLRKGELNIDWNVVDDVLNFQLNKILNNSVVVNLDNSRGDIRDLIPPLDRNGTLIRQPRFDYSHSKKKEDYGKLVSGFPLKFVDGHYKLQRTCGNPLGSFIGFMDDNTPVRVLQDSCNRMSNQPNRVWFYLDNRIQKINLLKVFNGPADNRSFCAYDLSSAKALFTWYSIGKSINGRYPVWVNMFDIWPPNIDPDLMSYWYSLCFSLVLADNRCVVTKFEQDNPVINAPEIFIDNPLCPTNPESFWNTYLDDHVFEKDKKLMLESNLAQKLSNKVKELYAMWNLKYCKGQYLFNVTLKDEPYFKYFDYPDFLTPYSGIIQIRKYAEIHQAEDLQIIISEIVRISKEVKDEIFSLLVNNMKYFQ